MNTSKNLSKLVKIALLSAIAMVIMLFAIPIIPMFSWLEVDLSEVPVLVGAFAFGPITGVVIEFLKNLLNILVTGSGTGFVGELANFIMGVSFVVPAAYIYCRKKTKKNAIIGMVVGGLCMQVAAVFANIYILLPAFGMSGQLDLMQYVLVGLVPVNGIKALAVSLITLVVYKQLSRTVFKAEIEENKKGQLSEDF